MEFLGKKVAVSKEKIADGKIKDAKLGPIYEHFIYDNKTIVLKDKKPFKTIQDTCKAHAHGLIPANTKGIYIYPDYEFVELPGVIDDNLAKSDILYSKEDRAVFVYNPFDEKVYELKHRLSTPDSTINNNLIETYNDNNKTILKCLISGKIIYEGTLNQLSIDENNIIKHKIPDDYLSYYRLVRTVKDYTECCVCFKSIKQTTHVYPCGHANICESCVTDESLSKCAQCGESGAPIRIISQSSQLSQSMLSQSTRFSSSMISTPM